MDSGHDEVANSIEDRVAGLVNALGEIDAAFFDQKAEDGLGEGDVFADKGQVLGDGGGMVGTKFGRKAQRDIDRENERATDGGNATDDVSAMDGSAVPCIASSMGSGDPNKRVGAIVGGNGDGLVEEPEVSFDADGFVITFGCRVESNLQDVAHGLEGGEKVAACVDDNHAAHPELEKEL